MPDLQRISHIFQHTAPKSLKATQVAQAMNFPAGTTGKGVTIGVIELGGAVNATDMSSLGLTQPTIVSVDGGKPKSDGPNGADGEVALDVQVIAELAPDATIKVYFAANSDTGFYDAFAQAFKECDVVSCSWGGPEDSWDAATMHKFDALFQQYRQQLGNIPCAAGDSGSSDGERGVHVDFPASSPNALACGGTQLTVNPDGSRSTEVTWDVNDTQSATGGGKSTVWNRQLPDVAANASPTTGYQTRVDGEDAVIGGTSAVAPVYAALIARLIEANGGKRFDFQQLVMSHPDICFDVTAGDNGAYRAGPGFDMTTGYGVVDGERARAYLTGAISTPTPAPTPAPEPTPAPSEDPVWASFAADVLPELARLNQHPHGEKTLHTFLAAANHWVSQQA